MDIKHQKEERTGTCWRDDDEKVVNPNRFLPSERACAEVQSFGWDFLEIGKIMRPRAACFCLCVVRSSTRALMSVVKVAYLGAASVDTEDDRVLGEFIGLEHELS